MNISNKASKSTEVFEPPKPLYEQVKRYVLDHIQTREWPTHSQIPSEHTLVKDLGMSRMTIHRALRELTRDGYLERIQGVGTFVAPSKQKSTSLSLADIRDTIQSRGGKYMCEVKFLQAEPATAEFASRLGLKEGDQIFRSYMVHREDNLPVMLEDRYTNPILVPGLLSVDFKTTSIDAYFREKCSMLSHEHTVEATLSSAEVHHFMELDQAGTCLQINRRTWSGTRILSCAQLIYPDTRFNFSC